MKLTKSKLKQIIKEEATKQLNEWGTPEYTPEQQTVVDAMNSLTDLVHKMGRSDPEMVDNYIVLLRALESAGVDIKALARMV